jgi:hypothetical protein
MNRTPRTGLERDGAALIERDDDAVEGAGLGALVGGEDPVLLGFVERVVAPLPGAGPLRGDPHRLEDPAQVLA